MQTLPANIYSVASVREIDRTAIEDHGIPGYTLMSRAGAATFHAARRRFPDAKRWQVVCGAGNNGGDGYVVARLAAQDGIVVSVLTLVDPESLSGDAATAYGDFVAEGGVVMRWRGELDAEAELLVDAMLGSGLERDVAGEFAKAVAAINEHAAKVLAVDVPTGINADSGARLGCAVKADMTVTFVGLKTGLFLDCAPDYCGELLFEGLEIPEQCRAGVSPEFRRIDDALVRDALPPRRRAAHKGDFGHVLVVGGGDGMPGAVRLCGEAALRAGAGLVSIATAPTHAAVLAATRPELMPHAVEAAADLEPLLEKADVIAFGPGLGRSDWARLLFEAVATDARAAVWDADALHWLAQQPNRADARIITPHPGEAGALLQKPTAEIQTDRLAAVQALQQRYGGVAVLKGSGSLISAGAEVPSICTSGNPGMASAGMGDVLTGIIAALLAQGLSLHQAALVGVEAHARAGDTAASKGQRGLIASDLIAELRDVINP
ncbi:MAG: NAD(P)H-hydrate dehydratase [Gammaproteobacteria bacterium]|nr:NAD(P)H-hydrate dehydratase [Gammaproteobacteria bacterium]NND48565.1 NAD(P)H-hydrate dehydratase [Woeseiaceae bacterium]